MSETYTVVIRSEGRHSVPFAIRLRQFLKQALRCYGLRAIDIRPTQTEPPATPAEE